jgi:hypothetical protein
VERDAQPASRTIKERTTLMAKPKKTKEGGSVDVTVFVPRGMVRSGDIMKAALLAARDQIPVAAFDHKLEITSVSDVKTVEGQEGRDYTVTISFKPRRTTDPDDATEEVTIEKLAASLEPLTPEKLAEVTGSGAEA